MNLTAPKTSVLAALAVSCRAAAPATTAVSDPTLAFGSGAVADFRTCGNF